MFIKVSGASFVVELTGNEKGCQSIIVTPREPCEVFSVQHVTEMLSDISETTLTRLNALLNT